MGRSIRGRRRPRLGLIDYEDRQGGEVCGVEFWLPEEIFPADLLDALPDPTLTWWERRQFGDPLSLGSDQMEALEAASLGALAE